MEESPAQIERNMRSIGIDLARWRKSGQLIIYASRSTMNGLESHLTSLVRLVKEIEPQLVVIDPISSFDVGISDGSVKMMLIRAVDLLKNKGITSLFTCLTPGNAAEESTAVGISSLVDVWLLLRNLEAGGERTRGLYVCKARGTAHSNKIREFILTDNGVRLEQVVLDEQGNVLTGSVRIFKQQSQMSNNEIKHAEALRRRSALEQKRSALEARIAVMRADFDCEARKLESELIREIAAIESENSFLNSIAQQRSGPSYV
jgi:circadian clock protein KaiC